MDDRRSLTEQLEHAWGQALMAVSSAEDEAGKLIQRWGAVVGAGQDEVRRQVRELAERLTTQRRALEGIVEERVRSAVGRVRVPKREKIQELERRLDGLAARVQTFREGRR